ncbi:HBB protein, partial [Nothocercus nigrocapillus]|nr:HBB protein [Nothocercus nigrocapillus]
RLLIIYPWTQRFLDAVSKLSSFTAILGNPKIHAHGKKVLTFFRETMKNLGNIKKSFVQLSKFHCEKLHVDPANIRVSDAWTWIFTEQSSWLIIVLAAHFAKEVTSACQATGQKLVHLLAQQDH